MDEVMIVHSISKQRIFSSIFVGVRKKKKNFSLKDQNIDDIFLQLLQTER